MKSVTLCLLHVFNFYTFKILYAIPLNVFYITFLCLILILFIMVYFFRYFCILFLISPPFASFIDYSLCFGMWVASVWWLQIDCGNWSPSGSFFCVKIYQALESLLLWGMALPSGTYPHYISHGKRQWRLHLCCSEDSPSFNNAVDAPLLQLKN